MLMNRIVEYVFFFGFMVVVGYLVWEMVTPFVSALALSAIIVTICYPLYIRVLKRTPWQNQTLAALCTTLIVLLIVIIPLFLITSALVNEAVSVYKLVNEEQIGVEDTLQSVELSIQRYFPAFEMNVTEYLRQSASWLASNLGGYLCRDCVYDIPLLYLNDRGILSLQRWTVVHQTIGQDQSTS